MSSGLVSQRTRMTSSPARPRASAVSASKTARPDAAPGRRGKTRRDDVVGRARVEHRVQEVVELRRVDARDRVVAAQQPLLDHRDGGPDRGGGRPLRGSGLEQVQPALLDRELDVLHVAVVPLEPIDRLLELVERGREQAAHVVERVGAAGCPRRRPPPER